MIYYYPENENTHFIFKCKKFKYEYEYLPFNDYVFDKSYFELEAYTKVIKNTMKTTNGTNIEELKTLLMIDKTTSRLNSLILAIGRTQIPGESMQFSNTILLNQKKDRLVQFYNYLCEFILNIAHMEYYTLWRYNPEIGFYDY